MSTQQEHEYMEARESLNHAMTNFIRAAELIGASLNNVASDVGDSLCDASERRIVLTSTDIK